MCARSILGMKMQKILCLLALLVSPLALANTLNKVNFSQLPGERFEVRLGFTETPSVPKSYTIEKPARIVFDFPDVVSGLAERRFPLAVDNGQTALVLTSDGRTRVVLNLNKLAAYDTRVEGNELIVEVGSNTQHSLSRANSELGMVSNQAGGLSTYDAVKGPRVTNVDFRRGDAGEGRIILTLSNSAVNGSLISTGAGMRLTLKDAWIAPELRRRLDVMDFATPVSVVAASQEGENTVFNITASGEYDYLAYQTDNEYVVSVKPLTEREKQDKKRDFEYTGQKLSLDFQDIEVRAVLQILADVTEFNLVASDTVQGRITLRLQNVPWDQALELILKNKGLDKRMVGNVLMVAPAAEIAERERQEIATKKQLEELAPLRTEYIRVRYASAKEMFELFRGKSGSGGSGGSGGGGSKSTGSVLSERGQVVVDERTNSIILTDTSERIEAFKRLVDQIDIPVRQVMIEARIVIANTGFQRELGVRWGGAYIDANANRVISASGTKEAAGLGAASNVVNLAAGNPAGSIAVGYLNDNAYLDLELTALESAGYAEIVSQPKVITSDKQPAVIKTGSEIAYQETAPSGGTTTGFKEAVLKLDVIPQITPDNRIILTLDVSKDSIGEITASGAPTVDVTRLTTQVLVNNGQTIVLGGVFSLEGAKSESKVPVLGDIPFLGRLFKKTMVRQNKSELLIFVTPKLLADNLTN